MPKEAIRERVLDYLYRSETLSNRDAIELLGVSLSTVRRIMIELEADGLITRVHGGVRLKAEVGKYLFREMEQAHEEEKKSIALYAAHELVGEGDVVYLDSGTTVKQLALALSHRLLDGRLKTLTAITNSLANMEILSSHCNVILIGGVYREERKDFAGFATERFLECFNYQKAFLGADGFDVNLGFSGRDPLTVTINEIVISRSAEKYVLIDSSKFETRTFLSYANSADVDLLITDDRLSAEQRLSCEQKNIRMHVAGS